MLDAIVIHNYQYLRVVVRVSRKMVLNFPDEMADDRKRRVWIIPHEDAGCAQIELDFALSSRLASSPLAGETGHHDSIGDGDKGVPELQLGVEGSEVWNRSLP